MKKKLLDEAIGTMVLVLFGCGFEFKSSDLRSGVYYSF